jgi:hypothetical protein
MLDTPRQKMKGIKKSREFSLHIHQNYFWSFPGCNIYVQIAPDLLHQFFLGVVKALLTGIQDHLLTFEISLKILIPISKPCLGGLV